MSAPLTPDVIERLAGARRAEKEQALFYRRLSAAAEERSDADLAERLNGLLADEQHHLSRLTVRLVELEQRLRPLDDVAAPACALDEWEDVARVRERTEVARYEALLERALDARTRALVLDILESERIHEAELGGKWMGA